MTHFASLHTRKLFCFLIFCIAFSSFTADICDLREELQILSYAYNSIDDDITTSMTDRFIFDPVPVLTLSAVHWPPSVVVSSIHLPPCGFRAPPFPS